MIASLSILGDKLKLGNFIILSAMEAISCRISKLDILVMNLLGIAAFLSTILASSISSRYVIVNWLEYGSNVRPLEKHFCIHLCTSYKLMNIF